MNFHIDIKYLVLQGGVSSEEKMHALFTTKQKSFEQGFGCDSFFVHKVDMNGMKVLYVFETSKNNSKFQICFHRHQTHPRPWILLVTGKKSSHSNLHHIVTLGSDAIKHTLTSYVRYCQQHLFG